MDKLTAKEISAISHPIKENILNDGNKYIRNC